MESRGKSGGVFGGGRVGYIEAEIEAWIRARVRVHSGDRVGPPVAEPTPLAIISVAEAARRVGMSRVHLWRMEHEGRFPARIRLTAEADDAWRLECEATDAA